MRMVFLIMMTVIGTLLAAAGPAGVEGAALAEPVSLDAFKALPRPTPTSELRYGTAPAQAIDLFLPRGRGPHPVAILIHGGCWSRTTAGREQLRHLGGALAERGIAVWSIGYRRANETGGGYPGTFDDVAQAIGRQRDEAPPPRVGMITSRVVGQ